MKLENMNYRELQAHAKTVEKNTGKEIDRGVKKAELLKILQDLRDGGKPEKTPVAKKTAKKEPAKMTYDSVVQWRKETEATANSILKEALDTAKSIGQADVARETHKRTMIEIVRQYQMKLARLG